MMVVTLPDLYCVLTFQVLNSEMISPFPKFLPVSVHILSLCLRLNNFYFYRVRVLA